jgi:hypothetical protein
VQYTAAPQRWLLPSQAGDQPGGLPGPPPLVDPQQPLGGKPKLL